MYKCRQSSLVNDIEAFHMIHAVHRDNVSDHFAVY